MSTALRGARSRRSPTVGLPGAGRRRSRAEAFNQTILIFLKRLWVGGVGRGMGRPGGRVGEGLLPTDGSIEGSQPYNSLYLAVRLAVLFSAQFISPVGSTPRVSDTGGGGAGKALPWRYPSSVPKTR